MCRQGGQVPTVKYVDREVKFLQRSVHTGRSSSDSEVSRQGGQVPTVKYVDREGKFLQ